MGKIKTQHFVCFLLIAVFAIAIQTHLYGQDYLPKERENEIKMSEKYYWGEGSDFIEELAKLSAFVELSNQIIKDAVGQSEQQDEILKTIQMGAHLERLQQQGKIKILAWIVKDSVLLTVTTQRQRPITQTFVPKPDLPAPVVHKEEEVVPPPEIVPTLETIPTPEITPMSEMKSVSAASVLTESVPTKNPVLQELAACRTYKDVKRVATKNGIVRGQIGKGSIGFLNPENCIIAVFSPDGTLSALLDTGGDFRTDLLSGNKIQNPDRYYNPSEYYLWYMQQKN